MPAQLKSTIKQASRKKGNRTSGHAKRLRGHDFTGEGAAIVVKFDPRRRVKQTNWEKVLRRGQYADALDSCLSENRPAIEVLTLLKTCVHRSALRSALSGRDEVTLQPVLKWLLKNIPNPKYADICVDAAILTLDLYGSDMGKSAAVDALVRRLHERVREEVEKQAAGEHGGRHGGLGRSRYWGHGWSDSVDWAWILNDALGWSWSILRCDGG